MYDASLIARYVIHQCVQNKRPISRLKLQKILYFVQAEFLVSMNQPCFEDIIEAWSSGPVVPAVYFAYRMYGDTNLPDQGDDDFDAIAEKDKDRLNAIINDAAKYAASQLAEITRNQHPWKSAYKRKDRIIRKAEIREYFES